MQIRHSEAFTLINQLIWYFIALMQPFWILLQGGIYVFQTKVLYQSSSRLKGIDATKRQIEFLKAKEQIHKLFKQEH